MHVCGNGWAQSMRMLGAKYADVGCLSMERLGAKNADVGCLSMERLGASVRMLGASLGSR